MRQRTCSAILILSLLIALPFAAGAEMTYTPLDSLGDGYGYQYWLSGPQIGLFIPIRNGVTLPEESPSVTILQVADPTLPDSILVFFAIAANNVRDLENEDDAALAVATIASTAETLPHQLVKDDEYGIVALSVQEPMADMYSDHYVVLHDGWILNAMVQRRDGATAVTEAERAWQMDCMRSALAESWIDHQQSYTLPGSDITLDLPEGYALSLLGETDTRAAWSIHAEQTGVTYALISSTAARLPAFEDIDIADADDEVRAQLAGLSAYPIPEDIKYRTSILEGKTFLYYTADDIYHVVSIRDGWGLHLETVARDSVPAKEAERAQDAVMRRLLGNENVALHPLKLDNRCRRVGNALWVSLFHKTLVISVPEGYKAMGGEETEAGETLLAFTPIANKAPTFGITISDLYGYPSDDVILETMLLKSLSPRENEANYTIHEAGIMGRPTLISAGEQYSYAYCMFIANNSLITVYVSSPLLADLDAILAQLQPRLL